MHSIATYSPKDRLVGLVADSQGDPTLFSDIPLYWCPHCAQVTQFNLRIKKSFEFTSAIDLAMNSISGPAQSGMRDYCDFVCCKCKQQVRVVVDLKKISSSIVRYQPTQVIVFEGKFPQEAFLDMDLKNMIATLAGLVALCGLITACIYWLNPIGDNKLIDSAILCAVAVPIALWCWFGPRAKDFPSTWLGWIGFFIVGAFFSFLYLEINCSFQHPYGIGLASCHDDGVGFPWTISAIFFAIFSLPGALRRGIFAILNRGKST
jgi:hypothetical protein